MLSPARRARVLTMASPPLSLSLRSWRLVFLFVLCTVIQTDDSQDTMSFSSKQNLCHDDGGGAQTTAAANINRDVYMVRHSARVDSEGGGWTPLSGHSRDDAHLSAGGMQASLELAERFKSIPIAHIVSSPYIRCLQTVAPIAAAKNIPIKIEPGICEVLNGQYPPGFKSTEQLAHEFPIDADYTPVMQKHDLKREWSDGDAADRSRLVATNTRNTLDGPILFCGHGASCLGIAEAFGDSGYVGYSSFSHYVLDGGKWKVKASGDVSHLSEKLRKQSLASAWWS